MGPDIKDASYLLFLIVLLPVVPAFVLFKFLPESSKADVAGPYQKLKIKLGGAFAGYFVVALLLSGLLSRYFLLVPGGTYHMWSVRGQINLDQGELKEEMFAVTPPRVEPMDRGEFRISGIPINKDSQEDPPILRVQLPGSGTVSICLEEDPPFERDYTVERDEENRVFIISPIDLVDSPYVEDEGEEPILRDSVIVAG
jgi:hypothetical protein